MKFYFIAAIFKIVFAAKGFKRSFPGFLIGTKGRLSFAQIIDAKINPLLSVPAMKSRL